MRASVVPAMVTRGRGGRNGRERDTGRSRFIGPLIQARLNVP